MKVRVKSRSLVDNECMDILMLADPRGVEPAEIDNTSGRVGKHKANRKEVVVECLGPYA